jgi:hypothetical protein
VKIFNWKCFSSLIPLTSDYLGKASQKKSPSLHVSER